MKSVRVPILLSIISILLFSQIALADTNITTCGNLITPDTYYLQNDLFQATTCIRIQSNDTILDCQNYNIQGNNASSSFGISISALADDVDYTNITVRNCRLSGWFIGITVTAEYPFYSISDVLLTDNYITNHTQNTAVAPIGFTRGVRNSILQNNLIENTYTGGIGINNCTNITVRNNTIRYSHIPSANGGAGISLNNYTSNIIVENNVIYNLTHPTFLNQYGIYAISGAFNNTIRGNIISNTSNAGIGLNAFGGISVRDMIVENNTLTDTGGINFNAGGDVGLISSNHIVRYNYINGSTAFYFTQGASDIDVYGNTLKGTFISNGIASYNLHFWNNYIDSPNFNLPNITTSDWNTTYSLDTNILGQPAFGGNYWSSESCDDIDGNGICDSPFVAGVAENGENITDYLPLSGNWTLCVPNYTLISTENQCVNSSNYMINTTYYDTNECDYPYLSNYTYPILPYSLVNTNISCFNSSTLRNTFTYNDTQTCGYSTSNYTDVNCTYGCLSGVCQPKPEPLLPPLLSAMVPLLLGIGFLMFLVYKLVESPPMTAKEITTVLIFGAILIGLIISAMTFL